MSSINDYDQFLNALFNRMSIEGLNDQSKQDLGELLLKIDPETIKRAIGSESDLRKSLDNFVTELKSGNLPPNLRKSIERGNVGLETLNRLSGLIANSTEKKVSVMDRLMQNYDSLEKIKLERGRGESDVYRLKDKKGTVVAYEKPGPTLEKVAWDSASIMGEGKSFPETTLKKDLSSVQLAIDGPDIQGMKLYDYMLEPKERPEKMQMTMEGIIDATTTSLFMSMSDAHSDNIWVGGHGEIIFQDNTRSLHHSNGFYIGQNGELFVSYHCGLLSFDQSFQKLSSGEISRLKQNVARLEAKMPELETYYRSVDGRQFPEGWWDPQKVIKARREMIDRMKTALDSGKVNCLADLVFMAVPEVKFMMALNLVAHPYADGYWVENDPIETMEESLQNPPTIDFKVLIRVAAKKGMNPEEIQRICHEETDYATFIEKLDVLRKAAKENPPVPANKIKFEIFAEMIIRDAYKKAEIDFKDLKKAEIDDSALDMALIMMKSNGIPVKDREKINILTERIDLPNKGYFVLLQTNFINPLKKNLYLYKKDASGHDIKVYSLDYESMPGYVKIENTNITLRIDRLRSFLDAQG